MPADAEGAAPAAALAVEALTVTLPPGADRPFAVEDVSFSVNAGELVCVVGEPGSAREGHVPDEATGELVSWRTDLGVRSRREVVALGDA